MRSGRPSTATSARRASSVTCSTARSVERDVDGGLVNRTRRAARIAGILGLGATIAIAAVAACTTDYQKGLDDPNYGGPNSLASQRPPGPSIDNQVGEGGTSSGGTAAAPLCVRGGGTLVDAGACEVSFSKDILAAFGNAAPPCATAGGCHLGVTPPNEPRVEPSDPDATWAAFAGFQLGNLSYINPCSTDPAQSAIACNLYSSGRQGACGVHMPQGGQIADDVITKIETWLKCGSPNN